MRLTLTFLRSPGFADPVPKLNAGCGAPLASLPTDVAEENAGAGMPNAGAAVPAHITVPFHDRAMLMV